PSAGSFWSKGVRRRSLNRGTAWAERTAVGPRSDPDRVPIPRVTSNQPRGTEPLRIVIYYPRASVGDGGMSGAVRRLAAEMVLAGGDVTMAFDEPGDHPDDDGVRWRHAEHAGAG